MLIFLSFVLFYFTAFVKRLRYFNIVPSSILVGFLLCLIGPNGIGDRIENQFSSYKLILQEYDKFSDLPGQLIIIVFACIFLGKKTPSIKTAISKSKPHLFGGYWLGFGQHFMGMLVGGLVFGGLLNSSADLGILLPISFQGGHGTVAGMADSFTDQDSSKIKQIGYAVATFGVLLSIAGVILSSNYFDRDDSENEAQKSLKISGTGLLSALGLVLIISILAKLTLSFLTAYVDPLIGQKLFRFVPAFPVAMTLAFFFEKFIGTAHLGENRKEKFDLIQDIALSVLLVSAIGSLDFGTILEEWKIVLGLSLTGFTWNALSFYFIFPKFYKKTKWNGVGEFCQCSGTSALGLLAIKDSSKEVKKGFNYKQILFEPILGGGLATAFALPLVMALGWKLYLLASFLILVAIYLLNSRWNST